MFINVINLELCMQCHFLIKQHKQLGSPTGVQISDFHNLYVHTKNNNFVINFTVRSYGHPVIILRGLFL